MPKKTSENQFLLGLTHKEARLLLLGILCHDDVKPNFNKLAVLSDLTYNSARILWPKAFKKLVQNAPKVSAAAGGDSGSGPGQESASASGPGQTVAPRQARRSTVSRKRKTSGPQEKNNPRASPDPQAESSDAAGTDTADTHEEDI
ncbi:hypothetical protein N7462_008474 [Penicillium macrosclerotiorum]|uniref:uncharacterized protein n=1 Tax=Penicillium macrosclerotiorum TaxID=303699 RepID=UPI00254843F1|nr:uncharacterized protein N7462_008474 [Penicillium macrosclerotiorum]KAJ5675577.1 hypothetical protein N7462_008474 [Penicillium macrosclerotiorum]